jgi:hypothetical protein
MEDKITIKIKNKAPKKEKKENEENAWGRN